MRVEHTRRQQARIAQADAEATYSGNLSAAAIADHQTKALRLIAGAVSS